MPPSEDDKDANVTLPSGPAPTCEQHNRPQEWDDGVRYLPLVADDGTPEALPMRLSALAVPHWHCPKCDADKQREWQRELAWKENLTAEMLRLSEAMGLGLMREDAYLDE